MGLPGRNRRITFRLVHIRETRGGLMGRECVWMDAAAIFAHLSR
jgi:hypothetical protein